MTSALDLITSAARLAGIVFKSEALDADEAQDGLESLNDMLASWTTDSLMVTGRTWESFSITGAASYTIGTGGTLNTVRPTAIKAAFIRSGDIDYWMNPVTDEQYESITFKNFNSPFPDYFSYDNGYPLGKIRLYPKLSPSAELHLLNEKPLTEFASINTSVDLPPGWKRAIRYNLAVEIAGEYGVEPPALVVKIAGDSLGSVQKAIALNRPLKYMPKGPRPRNIYTGYVR